MYTFTLLEISVTVCQAVVDDLAIQVLYSVPRPMCSIHDAPFRQENKTDKIQRLIVVALQNYRRN